MEGIAKEARDNGKVVKLSGELTIEHASGLRSLLLEAIPGSPLVELDVSGVESVDLACVQVLCAAHRFSVKTGGRMALASPVPEVLKACLKNMAMHPAACGSPYAGGCLWHQEEHDG